MNQSKTSQTDHQIIRCTLRGDKEMFGQLVHKYQNRLYSSMVQITRSEPEAQDVVQDAFVLAFSKLASFKGNSAFFTWLYRIAYNVAITRIRRKRLSTVSLHGNCRRSIGPFLCSERWTNSITTPFPKFWTCPLARSEAVCTGLEAVFGNFCRQMWTRKINLETFGNLIFSFRI